MKKTAVFIFALATVSSAYCQKLSLNLHNSSDKQIVDYVVEIPLSSLKNLPAGSYQAEVDGAIVPVEFVNALRGPSYAILPIESMSPGEKKEVTIGPGTASGYPKRSYAELAHKIGGEFEGHQYKGGYSWVKPNYLRVPDNFRDHAYYIKYEGPGWESDKVGFRFYLDQRNAIDVFGKKTPGIVLPFVGVDGYDSYHQMADWGMDNMKVGNALGIGSIAFWDGEKATRVEETDSVICHIRADGKVRSQVMTRYYGWNAGGVLCDLQSLISIDAGSRASHIELLVNNKNAAIATGINKDKNADFFSHHKPGEKWSYIASFGKQSLNNDNMGLALFVRTHQLKEITGDKLNHIVVLNPDDEGYVDYYIMPTWELDWEPVKTRDDFMRCIEEVLNRLNSEITIKTL